MDMLQRWSFMRTKGREQVEAEHETEELLKEIQEEANRQDRSLSWVVQQAWKIARERIKS